MRQRGPRSVRGVAVPAWIGLAAAVLCLCGLFTASAAANDINAEQQRLKRLEQSIQSTRAKLREKDKRERSINSDLQLYRRQTAELDSYITLLDRELQRMRDSIGTTQRHVDLLQAKLEHLQTEYAQLMRRIHRAGNISDEELLVAAAEYGSDMERRAYVRSLTQNASTKADEITRLRDSIDNQRLTLKRQAELNDLMIMDEVRKRNEFSEVIGERERLLSQVRNDKSALQKELNEKTASASKVKRIVALLVEKERKRREEAERKRKAAATRGGGMTGDPVPAEPRHPAFKSKSLPWPVKSRNVTSRFGKQKNPITETETENLGIGIQTPTGSAVAAVGPGTVSLVHWLPGYGSFVIVNHGNGFRTVYGNLSTVLVTEGKKIERGDVLGHSGKSIEGEYVHFELWKNRDVIDPLSFLH